MNTIKTCFDHEKRRQEALAYPTSAEQEQEQEQEGARRNEEGADEISLFLALALAPALYSPPVNIITTCFDHEKRRQEALAYRTSAEREQE